ncbi:MAG: hypothetical protein R6W80_16850 [Haliea sp.]
MAVGFMSNSHAFTLNVVDPDGNPVFGYRWLVEEDTTHPVTPGLPDPDSLGVSIHKSYAPVIAKGETASFSTSVNIPANTRYAVSVLPNHGQDGPLFTIGGANVAVGQSQVTVVVNPTPIPTAQISVFVFNDNWPLNGALDQQETGLGGFSILLFDAAGQMFQDAFGNPLGTVYDTDPGSPTHGEVTQMGSGVIQSGACPGPSCGEVLVKNLPQGKYGVQVVPPTGQGWQQTSTIEGSRTVDAWVKPNEPPFFVEFGPAGYHVFIGFTHTRSLPPAGPGITPVTISGRITNLHTSRPPDFTFYPGEPWSNCWVGLNAGVGGIGELVHAQPCDDDSNFTIPNVPPGDYGLVIWDQFLDLIIANSNVTVDANGNCNGGSCSLGDISVFAWFNRLYNFVFFDADEDGFPDDSEFDPDPSGNPALWGISEQNVNIRFRDGSIYQAFPTDLQGFVPFDEVFPFFKWLVAEVDFGRFKATGATVVTDAGGPVPPHSGTGFSGLDSMPSFDMLNPQPQCAPNLDPLDNINDGNGVYGDCIDLINPNTGNNLSRTETGEVLTQGFQGFLGLTNVIYWGKSLYGPGDRDNPPYDDFPGPGDIDHNENNEFDSGNGGISGVAIYSTTRAEDDPRFAAAEEWEPGIPRAQVNLYADGDVDNAPSGWASGGTKGPEDIDWNGDGIYNSANGVIQDLDGDGMVTLADVDNYPFGWRDDPSQKAPEDIDHNGNGSFDPGDALQIVTTDSWDDNSPTGCVPGDGVAPGIQAPFYINGNPDTPALDCFEGMRTFGQVRDAIFDGGYAFTSHFPGGMASSNPEIPGILAATYIVEAVTPPGYEHLKEEDKNVDFGDSYVPSPLLLPPVCVGERDHTNWFTQSRYSSTVPDFLTLFPAVEAPFAGLERPLCDRKQVVLAKGQNAAADFFMMTEVPKAGRIVGFILDDLANEFDPNAPAFGEKFAPPWLPVSIRDFQGQQIARVYSDQWGLYNVMVPSTYTVNAPSPTGVAPHMLTVCLNDPGPIPDPDNPGSVIIDPQFNPQYTQFCYTFDYWPGKVTYLDTPVLPVAAFAGGGGFPLDCQFPGGTPVISTVTSPSNGPYVPGTGTVAQNTITITSVGMTEVPNPQFDPAELPPIPKTVARDFGFGATEGTVRIGGVAVPEANVTWSDSTITVQVPPGTVTGELLVTRADTGLTSVMGVILHVGGPTPIHVPAGGSIQAAIDAAPAGSLIFVPPGTYHELVILYKDIKLQGWGAPSTIINAMKNPAEKMIAWRSKLSVLYDAGAFSLLPGQAIPAPPSGAGEPEAFVEEEGAGITVLSLDASLGQSAIDGLTITGGDLGGGIFVNAYADDLVIANNLIINNQGFHSGGIRIGNPILFDGATGNPVDSMNDNIQIHHNHISQNGGLNSAGGGISIFTGTENYSIDSNFICGNFSAGDGGGIGHKGLSNGGRIADNAIIFNQTFNQGVDVHGGGLYVGGFAAGGAGAGSVSIISNLFQGNLAGAGSGGGIAFEAVNGTDVASSPSDDSNWYSLGVYNNMIGNNVAGLAGGGISLQDAVKVNIIHNTIANNDSTATAGAAFSPGVPNESNPQPAGVFSRAHSPALTDTGIASTFSNPLFVNNIVWHNRSFHWVVDDNQTPAFSLQPPASTPDYWDLGVLGTAVASELSPQYSILSSLIGPDGANYSGASNQTGDPVFIQEYVNESRPGVVLPEVTTIEAAPAFDEGGNFIDVRFGPLTLVDPATGELHGDYHIDAGSPASGAATNGVVVGLIPALALDIDDDARPQGAGPDIGADERVSGSPFGGIDSDGDGIVDSEDNCTDVANTGQVDTDGDGYGDRCDGDLNNNGTVDFQDLATFRSMLGSTTPEGDFNGNGTVDFQDLATFRSMLGQPPGPSGLVP